MRKLYILALLVVAANFVNAQSCTPTWAGTGAGIYPDSATNLPVANAGTPYNAVINFKVPKDTTYGFFDVTVVDITIENVDGFDAIPSDVPFSYSSNPSSGVFKGDSIGCVSITGTPKIDAIGDYPITVNVTAHGKLKVGNTPISLPQSVDYYRIAVWYPVGVENIKSNDFTVLEAQPNPANQSTVLNYYMPQQGTVNLKVFSVLGQLVAEKNLTSPAGINAYTLLTDELATGQYFYTLSFGSNRQTKVLSIAK